MAAKRILIVDDEADVRKVWLYALRHAGFSVWEAESGTKALALADEHPFDLVVLDFIMPGMNGVELLARLRKKLPFIRSIVVSGRIDATLDQQTIAQTLRDAVEADRYMNKPVSNDELLAAASDLLKPQDAPDWQDIAKGVEKAAGSRIQKARAAARLLKAGRLSRRPKN